jgi:hypothetical protein
MSKDMASMEEKRRMPKTVRPKNVVIGDKAYVKCPYPDCGYMVEDRGYNPKTQLRREMLYDPDYDIYKHVREAHELVWLNKGKAPGWRPRSKFHPRPA